jgi:hypothetical protein
MQVVAFEHDWQIGKQSEQVLPLTKVADGVAEH